MSTSDIGILVISVQVIHHERMVSSISTLMALCEKADSDIRACLNTLQVINPRRACAARVTVVVLCVCVSVSTALIC